MKLLADECCDAGMVDALRSDGYDVVFAVESMRGAVDDEILERAHNENRGLITVDKDFGELVYRFGLAAYAVILLRFDPDEHELKITRVRHLLEHFSGRIVGKFVVVGADKIRFRSLR